MLETLTFALFATVPPGLLMLHALHLRRRIQDIEREVSQLWYVHMPPHLRPDPDEVGVDKADFH